MNARLFVAVIAVGSLAAFPSASLAKGGPGGHGGGHGGHGGQGGHGGGHASGSHGGGHAGTATARGTGGHTGDTTSTTHVSGSASARPRGGQPVLGTAVPRTSSSAPFNVPPSFYAVPPSFYSARLISPFYRSRFGLGLGSYGGPYWSNFGYGFYDYYPPMYDSYGYGMYDMPSALPYEQPPQAAAPTGNLRLVIDPSTAQVFVDGYFVGSVDDLSDTLAGLLLEAGPHHLELRAPGYETLTFDARIEAQRTITYRGTLKHQQP